MKMFASYEPVTYEEITNIEKKYSLVLPEAYKAFLIENNGGQPERNKFEITDDSGELGLEFPINVFFGISSNDTSYDLLTMYSNYIDRIPEELIPIADDGVGNIICIGASGEFTDRIYMWWRDGEVEEGENPTFDNVDLVAENLDLFLKGIH